MLDGRLGINVQRDHWPTTAGLKAAEAAGFDWVQVHAPPIGMLTDRARLRRHARALRAVLAPTGLRLVLHGPDNLQAGSLEHDRALEGLVEHASECGAQLVVYHGLNHHDLDGPGRAQIDERVSAELRSLRRIAPTAERLNLTIAVENLAPTYPIGVHGRRLTHDPLKVRELVRAVRSPNVGLLLDLGHAHITNGLRGTDMAHVLREVADDVVLFHVHDNLGARRHDVGAPGLDPLRLDLHLAPGAGSLPWDAVAPVARGHGAPLLLEVKAPHRPELRSLAAVTGQLLTGGGRPAPLAA